ncbi:hypothetical protein [Paratractidigestivibacter sp.]|uniref:hypothetical protein n=1 Tax=Paratractidigestivibacter sp. TaxID=2847316 RepID=UPI002ACB0957|nr:hypothetical protein [Paratractidigestivibacter sp.]
MRKIAISRRPFLSAIPAFALSACTSSKQETAGNADTQESETLDSLLTADDTIDSKSPSDTDYQQYVQSSVYASVAATLPSEDYVLDDVHVAYVSQEFIEELEFNSQKNVYFGYTLDELAEQFQGAKYVFTSDNGKTVARAFEEPDNTFNEVVTNVAIGAGVILVCAAISIAASEVATAAVGSAAVAAGAKTINVMFAFAAKSGATLAVTSSLGSIASGVVSGLANGDVESKVKEIASEASEKFKWGAIVGAAAGALLSGFKIATTVTKIREASESEKYVQSLLGGESQKSYMNGASVSYATSGSTRPDIVRWIDNHLEAIEVKNYRLDSKASLYELKGTLKQEITARTIHMPEGTTQRVVLDIGGHGFSNELVSSVIEELYILLKPIDPNVIIEAVI